MSGSLNQSAKLLTFQVRIKVREEHKKNQKLGHEIKTERRERMEDEEKWGWEDNEGLREKTNLWRI